MTESGFRLFMLGAEQAGWRRMLAELGVRNIGLSFASVRKRLPKRKSFSMDWGFQRVFLDSGGFSANKEPAKCTQREWREYAREYVEFATEHLDHLDLVSEFDCLALGPAWIEQLRTEVWDHIPPGKFLPIWHPEHGLPALEEIATRYQRVGIAQDHIAMPGMNVTPYLNKLANQGVALHGLAMSRPDAVHHVRFASVSSTSWLSAMRYGETIIWDGARLVRYPSKMKAQARLRHRGDFERAGFDVAKIEGDDANEVTRVAIWSWLQYEASVEGQGVTANARNDADDNTESTTPAVGGVMEVQRKQRPAPRTRDAGEMTTLPVLDFRTVEAVDTDSDEMRSYQLPVISSRPLRQCDTCVVREDCPKFSEHTTCAFDIPIEVRTPSQRKALLDGMVEMQAQRVAFLRFVEEMRGGYSDANLSSEIDRLMKVFQTIHEIEDDRDTFRMSVEAKGKAGVLSRLFGREAAEIGAALPNPMNHVDTDRVLGRVIKGTTE